MKAYLSIVRCRYKMYAPSSGTHERHGEELPEVISSRGWRHQQLIYLPHIINCILFMRSSPHLTSPHLTSPHLSLHVPLFLLVSLCSPHYDTSAPPIQSTAAEGWQVDQEEEEGWKSTWDRVQARSCSILTSYVASVTACSRLKVLRGYTYLQDINIMMSAGE